MQLVSSEPDSRKKAEIDLQTIDDLEDRLKTELLTIDELSERLKVPNSWVYARTRETGAQAMPRLKVGKYLRFEWDAVMAWIRKQNEV